MIIMMCCLILTYDVITISISMRKTQLLQTVISVNEFLRIVTIIKLNLAL
jgi:hypothetical protein